MQQQLLMNLNGQIFPLLIFQFEMMNMRGFCGWLTAMAVDEAILVNLIGFMMFEWKGAHQITFPPCQCNQMVFSMNATTFSRNPR